MRLLQNAQVSGLLDLGDQRLQMELGAVPQIVLLDGAAAKVAQPQAQTKLACRCALHDAVSFQHHEEAMRGALVQIEGGGNFRQAHRRRAAGEQIQHREGPIERLQFVNAVASLYRIVRWHAVY